MKITLADNDKTQALGKRVAQYALSHPEEGKSIFFFGDIGSGKTTCIQGIAKELGIMQSVQSPTFALSNEYFLSLHNTKFENFIHIDMYRCSDSCALSIAEIMEKIEEEKTLVAIEWAEYFPVSYLPASRIEIHFSKHKGEFSREVDILVFRKIKQVEVAL